LEEEVSPQCREQRLVFGEVAELYDRYRPGYPDAVFDRIMRFGELDPGVPGLEVGCGTGRATVPLAARGLRLTALEPSSKMARVAIQNTKGMVGVRIVEASFEDWLLPREPFRVVTSAQAWHWIQPEVRFIKAHEALGVRGCLALFWNIATQIEPRDGLQRAIEDAYRREAPGLVAQVPGERSLDRGLEIEDSGLFIDITREVYPWATTYPAVHYLGLLQTQSDYRLLEPAVRTRLLQSLASVLADHGNQVPQGYCTFLYLARRRD
jgi:SAM-dependent methyltransferase